MLRFKNSLLDINEDIFSNYLLIIIESCDRRDYIYEEERMKLLEGMCFGEWGLIYGKDRTASAVAIEDCDLFYLDKENFEKSFAVNKFK